MTIIALAATALLAAPAAATAPDSAPDSVPDSVPDADPESAPDRAAPRGPDRDRGRAPDRDLVEVQGAAHPDAIDGRYIVLFDEDAPGNAIATATRTARASGATTYRRYATAVDGFAAKLPTQALRGLQRNPNVALIEADRTVSIADTQANATWGLDRSDQRDRPLDGTYEYTATGAGVSAYVVDTGIRASHDEFTGRVRSGYTAINDGRGTNDCNGHGTHVAGTTGSETWGVAKDVTLHAVRVLGCNGNGTNSGVIAGVDWVAANAQRPAVANMSLGGGASSALDAAIGRATDAGVTFVVAAGNENQNACNVSPARAPSAITVASSTTSDRRSSFSNYGSCVDLFAPGSGITSTWSTSNTATRTISGTSMASPHVAGIAALYLEDTPSASAAAVTQAIESTASTGRVTGTNGSPNLLAYSLLGGASAPDPDPDPVPSGCDLARSYGGSLSGTGDRDQQPNGTYYYSSRSGTHRGCISGPGSADFDLELYRWSGSGWVRVAASESPSSEESIAHQGSPGYYTWLVTSYRGSGSYTFELTRP